MKKQFIWTEYEMCEFYFKILMQNVLGLSTEAEEVGIQLIYDRVVTLLWMTLGMTTGSN